MSIWDVDLWKQDGKERLYHSRLMLDDIATSEDGHRICLAGNSITIYTRNEGGWERSWQRSLWEEDRRLVAFIGNDLLAVVIDHSSRLEIWSVAGNLEPLAEAVIPEKVTCLAASGNSIVMGCQSGQLISYHLERK